VLCSDVEIELVLQEIIGEEFNWGAKRDPGARKFIGNTDMR